MKARRVPLATPEIRRSRAAEPFSMSSTGSFDTSHDEVRRQVIEFTELIQVDLLGVRCIRETVVDGRDLVAALPVPSLDAVLRRLVNLLGGNRISVGIRTITVGDPNLPIDLLGAKREMIAFDAADHAAAQVLHVDHL